ncbi:uncharacterized protein LOC143017999, partial [Oratosquilla oratoria]|uniref:uncharacterized protein LOC143017999 n=1 Tax=Oratosquilla oratoria TaxID=337810 RepID=UPI003F76C729
MEYRNHMSRRAHRRDAATCLGRERVVVEDGGEGGRWLAKYLAKPLPVRLGSLSKAHLKNSHDLIERMRNVDLTHKTLVSYDVTSLFTNVSIEGALKAAREVVSNMRDEDLPLGKEDFLKLISLCVRFGSFVFNDEEFFQCRGLAMGSPLSAVLASLYMELLERDHFVNVMGQDSTWMRYVDDVLVVAPRETNLNEKLNRLNGIEQDIQFTMEHEENSRLAFLDTVVWRKGNKTAFSVYRKSTNKDDIVHFYSAHNDRIKSGIVI